MPQVLQSDVSVELHGIELYHAIPGVSKYLREWIQHEILGGGSDMFRYILIKHFI